MLKKRLLVMIAVGMLICNLGFAQGQKELGGSSSSGPSGKLVVYSTAADEEFNIIVGGFQEKYPNIKVEAVQAGAGELKTRIKAEAENPQADIMSGLNYPDYLSMKDNWQPYVAKNNDKLPASMQNNTEGCLTYGTVQLVNLLVNKAEAKKLGVEINSYMDLLNPKLKGKIISANPAASSSAWNQLSTMLAAMGGYESQSTWDYLDKLAENLGGVMSGSSSNCYKTVLAGEYVVGITYEAPCVTYIEEGQGDIVEIVYPTEGINAIQFASAIIKGAKNIDNAQLYIDWLVSDELQGNLAKTTQRQANISIPTTNPNMKSMTEIKIIPRDEAYLAKHQVEILDRWQKIWAKYN